ncbi:phage tail protein [Pseudomonas sp. RP23018S]|uniref:phage tail protein n=1 Tax=Pseudomonas sp. RP23018S TaxID=3096037 RepID=UPI002ACA270F|nr:phage tail protein [Pseudomonas sp. RP23018S]MDZ5601742.1 phage tail protein [Pseudomonas sp. RP23018S]
MAETYTFATRLGASGEVKQRVWENEFGDGYAQSGGTGINTKSEEWSHQASGRLEAGQELRLIRDFLDRHQGFKSFNWTPPGGVPGRYKANGYKLDPLGAGLYRLSFTMKQTFTPY